VIDRTITQNAGAVLLRCSSTRPILFVVPARHERRFVMGVIAVVMLGSIALYLLQQIEDLKS
jgi:hypothetical protein